MSDITALIAQARGGDGAAVDRLFAALYAELKVLARRQAGAFEGASHATSLVHEAYLKLAPAAVAQANDRVHFCALAARAMRQILIDQVRARDARRRGGDYRLVGLDSEVLRIAADGRDEGELLALDVALGQLADHDPDLARLVELRFFAGLELAEIASLVDRSERSLKRDWRRARAWLYRALDGDAGRAGWPVAGAADDSRDEGA
ncbi:MAG: ECF-type sigma factor [Pseudoxanthomonas sp.]|nr:ECF-type sigma factor [Pseudoxanthomonas sp.]